jgi:hypothetical protein
MPPTTHDVKDSNATYELTSNVSHIIQQGLGAHTLANIDDE